LEVERLAKRCAQTGHRKDLAAYVNASRAR
jgi:hypothetical protein